MKKIFKTFLTQNGFLPLTIKNKRWKAFYIKHLVELPGKQEIKLEHLRIKKVLNGKEGIYVYLNEKNEFLYIGKAKNLAARVYSHYKEAFQSGGVWQDFFTSNAGNLTVLWRVISSDRQRRAIEEMIEDVKPSKFDKIYPRGKRHLISTNNDSRN